MSTTPRAVPPIWTPPPSRVLSFPESVVARGAAAAAQTPLAIVLQVTVCNAIPNFFTGRNLAYLSVLGTCRNWGASRSGTACDGGQNCLGSATARERELSRLEHDLCEFLSVYLITGGGRPTLQMGSISVPAEAAALRKWRRSRQRRRGGGGGDLLLAF